MLSHYIRRSIAAFPLFVVACAAQPSEEASDVESENLVTASQAITALTSKTVPDATLSGVGVKLLNGTTYRIKNDNGTCAYRSGTFDGGGLEVIATTACDTNADLAGRQKWALYEVTPGNFQVCAPETLQKLSHNHCADWWNIGDNAQGPLCDAGMSWSYATTSYSAMCVAFKSYASNGDNYRMMKTYLAYRPWNYTTKSASTTYTTYDSYGASMGLVQWDPVGRYILESGRRWTRNSSNVVVPGKATGDASQKWTFY